MLKCAGYLISTISVLLLGAVAWTATAAQPAMRILLVLGMATAIAGMFLRWLSYRHEREKQERAPAMAARARATVSRRRESSAQNDVGGLENAAAAAPR